MIIAAEHAEFFRYLYAVLAVICATGFVATLVLRWEVLQRGEKVLRIGLIGEHLTVVYAGYTALKYDYPPTIVGAAISFWLLGIILGFAIWLADDILPGHIEIHRLSDRRHNDHGGDH